MKFYRLIFTPLLMMLTSLSLAGESASTVAFDYSAANNILVYAENGQKVIAFPKPLETTHSRGPAILYRDVLDALSRSQPLTTSMGAEKYIMDVEVDGDFKRFHVGEDWISDGQNISSFVDGNPVVTHIDKRLMVGKLAPYSIADQDRKYGKFGQSNEAESLTDEERKFIHELELQSVKSALELANELTAGIDDSFSKGYQPPIDEANSAKPDHVEEVKVLNQNIGVSNVSNQSYSTMNNSVEANDTPEEGSKNHRSMTTNKINWVYICAFFFVVIFVSILWKKLSNK